MVPTPRTLQVVVVVRQDRSAAVHGAERSRILAAHHMASVAAAAEATAAVRLVVFPVREAGAVTAATTHQERARAVVHRAVPFPEAQVPMAVVAAADRLPLPLSAAQVALEPNGIRHTDQAAEAAEAAGTT